MTAALIARIAGLKLSFPVDIPLTIVATALVWWFAARGMGTNIVATRGEPRIWLVAELEEPSTPIPNAVGWAALVPGSIAMLSAPPLWSGIYFALAASAVMYFAWRRRTRIPDAYQRDHGQTGAATILSAVELLQGKEGVGIVLTQDDDYRFSGLRSLGALPGRRDCILVGSIGATPRLCAWYWDSRPEPVLDALAEAVGTDLVERSLGRSGRARIPFIELRNGNEILAMQAWGVVGLSSFVPNFDRRSPGTASAVDAEALTQRIAQAADAIARAIEAMK